jgi:hypothetical protein
MKLKLKITKNIKNREIYVYFALVVIRIAFVFLPQYGYIHPDEFFQSVEVVAGKIQLNERMK